MRVNELEQGGYPTCPICQRSFKAGVSHLIPVGKDPLIVCNGCYRLVMQLGRLQSYGVIG